MSASKGVAIGSRWRPGHIERRESDSGFYESVNSPMHSYAEVSVQRALLRPPPRGAAQVVPRLTPVGGNGPATVDKRLTEADLDAAQRYREAPMPRLEPVRVASAGPLRTGVVTATAVLFALIVFWFSIPGRAP